MKSEGVKTAPTSGAPAGEQPTAKGKAIGDLVGSFTLSYLLGGILIAALFYYGGPWNVLANTRLLDVLIDGGVIKYHDMNIGVVYGVAQAKHYLMSQDPVDWRFVAAAVGVYLAFWVIMVIQFHGIGRWVGLKGSFGNHAKAFIYGDCYNRLFPFWMGNVAATTELEAQGESRQRSAIVLYIQDVFVLFATLVFALVGLFIFGWQSTILTFMWPFIILGVCYFIARSVQARGTAVKDVNAWRSAWNLTKQLWHEPILLLRLAVLALLAVFCDDFCPYFLSRAFTSDNVIMNVSFLTIQNGVVAGYVARLIPVTPGGIGQYEWAFAASLYLSGVGFPEAATIALLDCVVRNVTYAAGFIVLRMWYGAETNFPAVLRVFTRTRAELATSV
jgi:uncharacterized membrane protein YbhN (UPF0104 family)